MSTFLFPQKYLQFSDEHKLNLRILKKEKVTKKIAALLLFGIMVLMIEGSADAQRNLPKGSAASYAAGGLDLQAVGELFKETATLEEFEKALNDPEVGVNNLDLDENGEVDYIRVVEQVSGNTHLIILQVCLTENEYQDVAFIEVEKNDEDTYNMQVHGDEEIYGVDYYVVPAEVHLHVWPIITWIYQPVYRPYRSRFYFGFYPRWWRPYRPVSVQIYRTRTIRLTNRATFTVSRTSRVQWGTKIHYQSHSSKLVKKQTTFGRKPAITTNKRTAASKGKTTMVKKRVIKITNKKKGRPAVKAGVKKTQKTENRKKITVKKRVKKTESQKKKK